MEPIVPVDRAAWTADRRAVLAYRLRGGPAAPAAADRIPRRAHDGPAPLSFAQQRLWFLDRLAPGNPFYNVSSVLPLAFPVTPSVLERALNEVVRRHEALRTTFAAVDGQPVQVVAPELTVSLAVVDLREREDAEDELRRRAAEDARMPFDLERGPLFRATLLRLD
ncbi:MAG TPA: condensation domain-containing protein, partial [Longimicrobium sp.]|nr:condensation domain-containing protein [Longimicrobium sp.]